MISVIICSRTPEISGMLSQNIEKTIGCTYELLVINNSVKKYSIFEAYNLGIERSSGDYLCFIHDDILFHTKAWGNNIESIFRSDEKIGLIGIAGAKVKTKMPSVWWDCPEHFKVLNLVQHLDSGEKEHWQRGWQHSLEEEVVVVDGVFMAARKVDGIQFNDKLNGFHNYDMNISFEYISKGFKVVVTKQILTEHFSIGKLDKSWFSSTLQIHKMYDRLFPLTLLKNYDMKNQEFKNGCKFIVNLLEYKMRGEAIFLWLKLIRLKPKSKFHFDFFKKLKNSCLL